MSQISPAQSRRSELADAAAPIFLRYGYARTTMADIAKAAGISRPTLYLSFSDKDEVFRAVIEQMVARKLSEIRQGLARRSSLDAQLRYACESWAIEGFELMQASPDASDLFNLSFNVVRESCEAFEHLLVELLSAPLKGAHLRVTPQALAHVLVFGMRGFKEAAKSSDELRQMIGTQVATICAAVPPANAQSDSRKAKGTPERQVG